MAHLKKFFFKKNILIALQVAKCRNSLLKLVSNEYFTKTSLCSYLNNISSCLTNLWGKLYVDVVCRGK